MIKVVFFQTGAKNFDANKGGVQRIVRVLQAELNKLDVTVFLLSGTPVINDSIQDSSVFYLPDHKLQSPTNKTFIKNFIMNNNITHFVNEDALDKNVLTLISGIKGDVRIISVHNNCISCLEERYEGIFRANRPKLLSNLIDIFNAWWLVKHLFRKKMQRDWKVILETSDALVLYFESFKEELRKYISQNEEKIKIIANPTPFERSDDLSIKRRILYVGRIEKNQKRIDRLLLLWHRLHDALPEWSLDMVGDGSYMPEVRKYIAKHNLNRISIHGWQDPLPYWDNSDIFTLTSDFEGYAMVLVEAQARAVVPITFHCYSAIDEVVINGKSGIIVEDFDLDCMYNDVVELATNIERIEKMKANGGYHLKEFDKELIAKKWISLFQELQ